ncbi:cell wall-binding repeat-containing protein [Halobacillus sp. Nhm2S1]|uniref:cell wall-binding repeat-containing protein n=1 Tax=Halobacillus sp. Nhm2S1 TaxID=2866716 RepID=UPI001C7357A6|nr:cell wall-binding repeat-containing protein [Halobacillus sp. Nhm2S1]MBX0357668.1 cell wall-binding repeat-containing protein [Halobacillus sp. Nhm2S1]
MRKKNFVRGVSSVVVSSMVLGMFSVPAHPVKAESTSPDSLLVTEYVEGSSYNKALELYNGTGEDIDLSQYTLEVYSNGNTSGPASLSLEGTLADGDVFVLANQRATASELDDADLRTGNGVVNFNGNDVILLKKGDSIVDSLGQIGSADNFGSDVTLTRKADHLDGDTNPDDAFDPSVSFEQHGKDEFSYIGQFPDEGSEEEPPAPSEPVELSSIADARSSEKGTDVKIKGIATATFVGGDKTNVYIQDETGGIVVRTSQKINIGDEFTAEGALSDYYGLEQIQTESIVITEENKGVPAALQVEGADFSKESGEDFEGEYVELTDVKIVGEGDGGDYLAEESGTEFLISPNEGSVDFEVGKTYELLRGVVTYSFDEYRLIPRSQSDVIEEIFSVIASKDSGNIPEGSEVTLSTAQPDATIHYTMDESEPTSESQVYDSPITINKDTTIKAVVVKEGGETSEVFTYSYEVLKAVDSLEIHDIQGSSHISPYVDMNVEGVTGVVTALDGTYGYYIQGTNPDDDIATSEGIYVYDRNSGVSVGDEVSVNGEVKEWREDGYDDADDLLTTQITASDSTILSSENTLPDTVVIGEDRIQPKVNIEDDGMESFDPETDGLDFYESLEGMRIELKDAHVTSPPKYDEVAVYVDTNEDQAMTDAGGLLLTEEDANPERVLLDVDGYDVNVKVGDQLEGSVTGIVSYDYSNFKVRTTGDFPAIIDGGTERETTDLAVEEGKLNVATYNMENFSAETSMDKVNRIADSMVNNLKQPDIIGLVEVQDNNGPTDDGTVKADQSYQKLIDAIEAKGGPTYEFAEIAPLDKTDGGQPGGNIRVGFIYNPDRVSMVDKPSGDATTGVEVSAEGLNLNPGRIDPTNEAFDDSRKSLAAEFEFKGQKVLVVTNHFNSKGGDDALFGASYPIELGSQVQRLKQAQVLNDFVDEYEEKVDGANVVVLGDLNDFEFSEPLETLKGDVLTNMTEELPLEERYSYNYQGNSQVLDHILVNNSLAEQTKIDSVNINADFSEADGRASDHDPMLAQIEFGTDVERISGVNRYETAIEVSKKGWDQADTVVIARGDSFPDALAGAPLAYKLDAPILLTKTSTLRSEVKAEIDRLGAKHAVILGGDGAISDYVSYQLEGEGLSVERISGEDRYETAANIAARLDGSPEKAIIADGRNYPDALSGASYAAEHGYPVLLTNTKKLPSETKLALSDIGETIVLGGTNAVSEKVMKNLPNPTRYKGSDRYGTSAEIAEELVGDTNTALVATGRDFADALTGSVLAAKLKAPMLLVKPDDLPDEIEALIQEKDYTQYHVLGGTNAVSDEVKNELDDK